MTARACPTEQEIVRDYARGVSAGAVASIQTVDEIVAMIESSPAPDGRMLNLLRVVRGQLESFNILSDAVLSGLTPP